MAAKRDVGEGVSGRTRTDCNASASRPKAAASRKSEERQLTLPSLDSPLVGDVRNGRQIMMHAFFSHKANKKTPITELPTYDDGKVRIEVRGTKMGVATVNDAEILLYCSSLAADKLERGEEVGQEFTFTLKDFCQVAGLKQSGTVSKRLSEALDRLQETKIKTNVASGKKVYVEGFSWIEKYWYDKGQEQVVKGRKRAGRINNITIRFCDFIWRAIVIDRALLSYNREFFSLSPLKRRLYEIARVHCSERPAFRISLESLRNRVGTTQDLKFFKSDLEKVIREADGDPLLGFSFRIDGSVPPGKRMILSKTFVEFWDTSRDVTQADIPLIDHTYLTDAHPSSPSLLLDRERNPRTCLLHGDRPPRDTAPKLGRRILMET